MRTRSAVDRKPSEPVFEIDMTVRGLKAAGATSDRLRISAETRSVKERDDVIDVIRKLSSIPRWDVLRARIANRFTTREMVRAAGPGGESLDELLIRTAPVQVVVALPLLAPHIEPYLLQPTRSKAPRRAEGVNKLRMQLGRFVKSCGGPQSALLSHLDDVTVNKFLGELTNARNGQKADGKTVNRYRAALSGFATYCRQQNLIDRHPLRDGIVLKYSEKGGERMPDWFCAEHYRIYFDAIAESSCRLVPFFRLMISTGIDFEELLKLRVRDITFGEKVSSISTTRLKVDATARTIPFPAAHNEALRAHIAEHRLKGYELLYGMLSKVRTKSGISCYEVIAAHRAGRRALGHVTEHEAAKHKIERENDQSFRMKDLRHLAAIAWVRGSVNIEQVRYYLGHTDLSQTQVYARYVPKDEDFKVAVQALARAFDPS